jgi:RNA polymerase sigma-70 factor (ECF subfamily)
MTESDVRTAFNQTKDFVYRFAWRMTGSASAAEDIKEEVFLSLLSQPDRFDSSRGELGSFLIGVARNLAQKWLRAESRWSEIDREQFSIEPLEITNREMSETVAAAVASLPPLQREVLLLAQYEGFTLEEIARALNVEVGAVKARLFRARQNLKRILAPLQVFHGRTF